jgi:hypothetical protein
MSLGAIAFAALSVIAVLLPAGGAVAWSVGEKAVVGLSGLLVWGVLALLSRPKAVADEQGLTVINLTVRRRLEWAQVLRVNLRSGDPWVSLDLDDGTTLAVMAIQPGAGRAGALRDARLLRDLADHYGSADTGS